MRLCPLYALLPQGSQADPLAEVAAWQAAILGALPAVRPASPPPLQHVCYIIVQLYAHHLRQLPLAGPPDARWGGTTRPGLLQLGGVALLVCKCSLCLCP